MVTEYIHYLKRSRIGSAPAVHPRLITDCARAVSAKTRLGLTSPYTPYATVQGKVKTIAFRIFFIRVHIHIFGACSSISISLASSRAPPNERLFKPSYQCVESIADRWRETGKDSAGIAPPSRRRETKCRLQRSACYKMCWLGLLICTSGATKRDFQQTRYS
jgi:hypothetical protein